jgi:hypothetical protein
MEEIRNAYEILVGKPVGKRPPGRPRRGWEKKQGRKMWIRCMWFRIGTSGGFL